MSLLSRDEQRLLIDLLLRLPNIDDKQSRRMLVQDLPLELRNRISVTDDAVRHINSIVYTADGASVRQLDGRWPVILVIETAITIDSDATTVKDLRQLLDTAQTRAAAIEAAQEESLKVKSLEHLYGIVTIELSRIAEIQAILNKPNQSRLSKLDRQQPLRDIVLEELTLIESNDRVFNWIEDINDATNWLDTGRELARKASFAFEKCFQHIDARAIEKALRDIADAHRHCRDLSRHLERFITDAQSVDYKGTEK